MRVMAGTTEGIYSVESGVSRKVASTGTVRDIVRLGERLLAGAAGGVFVSEDDGESWTASGLEDYEVWQLRQASDGTLYAATQPAALFKSSDGGATWTALDSFASAPEASEWCVPVKPPLPGRARALVVDADNPARLWVGVEVGGIMRSEDGGSTWSFTRPGDNPDLHMMAADPAAPDVLYASTGYGRVNGVAEMVEGNAGVFRSDDGGKSWRYVWRGITPRYSRPLCIDSRAPHPLTVASAPSAFARFEDEGGASAMLYRTDDGGESWRSLCDESHSPSAANIHGLTPDPEHLGGVVIGTDTGEVWRVSEQSQWSKLGDGMPVVYALAAY